MSQEEVHRAGVLERVERGELRLKDAGAQMKVCYRQAKRLLARFRTGGVAGYGKAKRLIIQVKSGHVKASDMQDLKGVLEREKAAIGGFITLEEPSGPMKPGQRRGCPH